MTLATSTTDVPVRVAGFRGMSDIDETRLTSLGLRSGAVVTRILTTPLGDPLEFLVGTQLIAIEVRLLSSIIVEQL